MCTVTTVGVHRCGGRCTPSVFPRTATDGPHWRRVRLDAHRRVERASPCTPARRPEHSPVGAGGKGGCADDLRGSGERDACGAGGACAGRPCIRGRGARSGAPVRGRGSTARGGAFRQQYPPQRLGCPGETVTVAVKDRGRRSSRRGHRPERARGAGAASRSQRCGRWPGASSCCPPCRAMGVAAARRTDRDLIRDKGAAELFPAAGPGAGILRSVAFWNRGRTDA